MTNKHLCELYSKDEAVECINDCPVHDEDGGVCELFMDYKYPIPKSTLLDFVRRLGISTGDLHGSSICPVSAIPCTQKCVTLTNRYPTCRLAYAVDFDVTAPSSNFYELAQSEYADLKDHERTCYVGFPDIDKLDALASIITDAFHETCYLVGSATYTKSYRDIDIRLILPDDKYTKLFGNTSLSAFHALLCSSLSAWMKERTGLPIDFQIQSRSSSSNYQGKRHPLGMNYRAHLTDDQKAPWLVEDN